MFHEKSFLPPASHPVPLTNSISAADLPNDGTGRGLSLFPALIPRSRGDYTNGKTKSRSDHEHDLAKSALESLRL